MAPISVKDIIPKKSSNTQKFTNAPNFISQSEPPAPKMIILGDKMWTGFSLFYVGIGSSVTQENIIPRRKSNMKSPAMSPPRNHPSPNQDINRLITKIIKVFQHI